MSKITDDVKKRLAEKLKIKLKEKSREELEDLLIDKIYGDSYSTCTDVIRKTLQKDLPTIVVEELKELCKSKEFLSRFIMTSSNYNDKIQVPQNWIAELLASSRDSGMFDDIQKEIHEHLKENYREILIETMKRIILNGIATSPNIGNVISDAISNSKDWLYYEKSTSLKRLLKGYLKALKDIKVNYILRNEETTKVKLIMNK